MMDILIFKVIDCMTNICKWTFMQYLLLFLVPYLWDEACCAETLGLIFLYTAIYAVYKECTPREKRVKRLVYPFVAYFVIASFLCWLVNEWGIPVWISLLLPIYGIVCLICGKLVSKQIKKIRKEYRMGFVIVFLSVVVGFVAFKWFHLLWACSGHGTMESEKEEVLERRNYLLGKLMKPPQQVLDEMPSYTGAQFQGEWALYSCSMFSAALVNMTRLYPETKDEHVAYIDTLINIVISPEIRSYDAMRWGEDPLMTLEGNRSHISYLSHLAWMICGYKEIGGGGKYDKLLSSLCQTMNRRILECKSMNLPTYPGEAIYIPDMLVAIVALEKYANLNNGEYRTTVTRWIERAKKEWIDDKTGLLVSFLQESGEKYKNFPIKGSYAALNCYYLTLIDKDFAKEQYDTLKSLFWKKGLFAGLKEYYDRSCWVGLDIDAGPILLELSPSGTAFMAGPASYFNDTEVRNGILTTAEIAGHTIKWGKGKRHYLLANVALVGESIMLAMRTNTKRHIIDISWNKTKSSVECATVCNRDA